MSVLSTFRDYFGYGAESESPSYTPPPTLEERLSMAAADRGYAFDLIEDAKEALADSAKTEFEVAQELIRRAERGRQEAEESARRILAHAAASAADKEEKASLAQRNGDDDYSAFAALDALLAAENADG